MCLYLVGLRPSQAFVFPKFTGLSKSICLWINSAVVLSTVVGFRKVPRKSLFEDIIHVLLLQVAWKELLQIGPRAGTSYSLKLGSLKTFLPEACLAPPRALHTATYLAPHNLRDLEQLPKPISLDFWGSFRA